MFLNRSPNADCLLKRSHNARDKNSFGTPARWRIRRFTPRKENNPPRAAANVRPPPLPLNNLQIGARNERWTNGRGRADGRHVLQGRREVCLRSRGGDVKMYIQCAVNRRLSGQNILRPCAVLHPMFPIVQPRLQKALAVESIRAMYGTCLESRLCIAVNGS